MRTKTADTFGELRVRGIWSFIKTQPLSFWLLHIYVFFEYVRPQQVYPVLDVFPWAQTLLLGALAAFFLEGRTFDLSTVAAPLLMAFTVIVLVSWPLAYSPSRAYDRLHIYVNWILVYVLITGIVRTKKQYIVFALLFLLCSFKMSQHGARSWMGAGFGFRSWGATGAPGWFHNSGEFGIQMCIFLPLSVAFVWGLKENWGKWKLAFFALFPITALMSIIASSSRGALLGAAAVGLWWLVFVSRRFRAAVGIALATAVVWVAIPEQQKTRLNQMGDDKTSDARLVRWQDGIEIMNDHPVLGVGYGNWIPYYPEHYGYRGNQLGTGLSHNIFIEAGSELGYTGLLGFLLLIFATFRVNWDTRRLARSPPLEDRFFYCMAYGLDGALVGFLASGFFVTVLYYPYFWFNLAMTVALNVAARRELKRRKKVLAIQNARRERQAQPA